MVISLKEANVLHIQILNISFQMAREKKKKMKKQNRAMKEEMNVQEKDNLIRM